MVFYLSVCFFDSVIIHEEPLVTVDYNYTPILHFVKGLRSLFNTFHHIFIFPIFWAFKTDEIKDSILYFCEKQIQNM